MKGKERGGVRFTRPSGRGEQRRQSEREGKGEGEGQEDGEADGQQEKKYQRGRIQKPLWIGTLTPGMLGTRVPCRKLNGTTLQQEFKRVPGN